MPAETNKIRMRDEIDVHEYGEDASTKEDESPSAGEPANHDLEASG